MFETVLEKLKKEVSGESAYNFVSELSRFHRIQASPGIKDAANFAVETFKGFGVDSNLHEYLADGKTFRWSCHMFKEWACRDAELRLIEPAEESRPLCLWSETKLSLMERSHPTPPCKTDYEVVVLSDGEEEEDYEGVDVSSKIVLTSGDVGRVYQMAVVRHGAAGIIYDGMRLYPPIRREGDLDDALERARSGGWTGDDVPCFGFILSPRRGRWLRKIVKEQAKKGKPVWVFAKVDAEFYSGKVANVVATIQGETDEEIIVVAHIDHPQGYSNDNASGCGAVVEAARAIQKLINKGELVRPRRTIRFLLVPEMSGTFAYLTENETSIPKMIAALNLDMVGENQNLCGGPLTIVKTPNSTPSFINVAIEAIFDSIKIEDKGISGEKVPLIKYAITQFSSGSDHWILSDPTVGVPCVCVAQWPDKFYHTSFDTLDKVDPEMLRKVTLLTATYSYFLANAGRSEALWLSHQISSYSKLIFADSARRQVTVAMEKIVREEEQSKSVLDTLDALDAKINFDLNVCVESLNTTKRLAEEDVNLQEYRERIIKELRNAAHNELNLARLTITDYYKMKGISIIQPPRKESISQIEREALALVPEKIYRGPFSAGIYTHRPWFDALTDEEKDGYWKLEKDNKENEILRTLAAYWVDGKRNLFEISNLLKAEKGSSDLNYLINHFKYLEKMKLIKLKRED
jgi:aminopeptidase-like protein